jgi:S1-C subfamily serine protease
VNLFDVVALVVLVAAILAGIRTGALPQVGGITGAIAGILVILAAAPWLLEVTGGLEPIPRALAVLGAVLAAVVAGEALGSTVGRAAAGRLRQGGVLSGMDRLAGGLLGGAQAILIIWLAGGLLAAGPIPSLARTATQSVVVRGVDQILPSPTEVVGQIAGVLDASGLPDVFVGLDPLPLPAVETPSDRQAQRIAGSALGATGRVTTRACAMQVTGTGFLVAPGYLVTNAHVVAGASTIRIALGSRLVDGMPVLFDPELDVALLYAPQLTGSPLRFAATAPDRGATGATLGYAGGGPMVVLPAGVTGSYQATGRDIYDHGLVPREIVELRAAIEPGDSGGPLVLQDGSVGGMVFAESRADPNAGYALSPAAVANRIAPAIGRTRPADVGACIR